MRRIIRWIGILLIPGAILYLLTIMGLFGEDASKSLLLVFVCDDDDTITSRVAPYGGRRILVINDVAWDFYCVDNEGQETDVTGQVALLMGGGFAGMLITGIIIVGSTSANTPRKNDDLYSQPYESSSDPTHDPFTNSGRSDGMNKRLMQDALESKDISSSSVSEATLTERLPQLEEARDNNLISNAEYERIRQSILDNMDDW